MPLVDTAFKLLFYHSCLLALKTIDGDNPYQRQQKRAQAVVERMPKRTACFAWPPFFAVESRSLCVLLCFFVKNYPRSTFDMA